MRLSRCLAIMVALTVLALIYIQLQVQIFDLAYKGKNKEIEMGKLLDDNGDVQHNICSLKSANHLGIKLLTDKSGMKFLEHDNVVEIRTSNKRSRDHLALNAPQRKQASFLANIFSLKTQAEARTIK